MTATRRGGGNPTSNILRPSRVRQNVVVIFAVTLFLTFLLFTTFIDLLKNHRAIWGSTKDCNWDSITEGDNLKRLETLMKGPLKQDDPRVIWYIRNSGFLKPPSDKPYNLSNPDQDPSHGQSDVIKKIFNFTKNRFFVECGAYDGEGRSNTLTLEKDFGWEGLLIEGDSTNFKILQQKHRKAWSSPACLSIHPYPHHALFYENGSTGVIAVDAENKKNPSLIARLSREKTKVVNATFKPRQCFPLFSLLAALNVSTVDYFSLDVEGSELSILETIPFPSLFIKVLSVEITHGAAGKGTLQVLKQYMAKQGYRFVTRVISPYSFANDLIFAHNQFYYTAKFAEEIFHWNSTHSVDNYYKT